MEGMAWDIFCLLLTGTLWPTLLCPGRLNDVWTELEARTQATVITCPFFLLEERRVQILLYTFFNIQCYALAKPWTRESLWIQRRKNLCVR